MSCAPSSPPYAWPGAGVGIPTSRKVWGTCVSRGPVPHLWSGTGSTLLLVCRPAWGPGEGGILVCDDGGPGSSWAPCGGDSQMPRRLVDPKRPVGRMEMLLGQDRGQNPMFDITDPRSSSGQTKSQRPSKTNLGTAAESKRPNPSP